MASIKIPVYERRVQRAALPGVRQQRVDVSSGLNAIGQGVQRLGQVGGEIALSELEKMDSAALMDAQAKASSTRQAMMDELSEHKGKDAGAFAEKAMQRYEQYMNNVEKMLGNNRQRELWQKIKTNHTTSWNEQVNNYVASEGQKYRAQAYEALHATEDQEAAREDYTLPNGKSLINKARETKRLAIEQHARNEGWNKDMLEAEIIKRMTPFHESTIVKILSNGDTDKARDYLGAAKDKGEISAERARKLQKAIEGVGKKREAFALAQEIIRNNHSSEWEFNLGQALKDIDAQGIVDPEKQKAVIGFVKERATDIEKSRDLYDGEKVAVIMQDLITTKKLDKNHEFWPLISEQGKERLMAKEWSLRNAGTKRQHEQDMLYWFEFLALKEANRVGVDVESAFPRASNTMHAKMRATQTSIKEDASKVSLSDIRAKAMERIREQGIDSKRRGGKKSDADLYLIMATDRYLNWKKQHPNEQPKEEDISGIFSEVEQEKTSGSRFFNNMRKLFGMSELKKPAYKVQDQGEQEEEPIKPSVPEADRKMIIQSYKKRKNREPTEEEIEQVYRFRNP